MTARAMAQPGVEDEEEEEEGEEEVLLEPRTKSSPEVVAGLDGDDGSEVAVPGCCFVPLPRAEPLPSSAPGPKKKGLSPRATRATLLKPSWATWSGERFPKPVPANAPPPVPAPLPENEEEPLPPPLLPPLLEKPSIPLEQEHDTERALFLSRQSKSMSASLPPQRLTQRWRCSAHHAVSAEAKDKSEARARRRSAARARGRLLEGIGAGRKEEKREE